MLPLIFILGTIIKQDICAMLSSHYIFGSTWFVEGYLHENSCEFVVIGVSLSEPRIDDFAVDFHSPEVIFSL